MIRPYFPSKPREPQPLRHTVLRRVQFDELDPLAIAWHGRYASYFEDARSELSQRYGIGYMDLFANGILAPIKVLHVDYARPLRFRDEISIEAILHFTESARINFEFAITNAEGRIATTGYSIQMMLDKQENVLIVPPPFYASFLSRWKSGELP